MQSAALQRATSRPGDWPCTTCRYSNYGWRSRCKNCTACKPPAAAAADCAGAFASSARCGGAAG
jgi:hypothetical protein